MFRPFDIRIIFKSGAHSIVSISDYPSFKSFVNHVNSEVVNCNDYIVNGKDYSFRANDVSAYELYTETKEERAELLMIMTKQELELETTNETSDEEPLFPPGNLVHPISEESQANKIKNYRESWNYSKRKAKGIEKHSKHIPKKGTLIVFQDPSSKHYDFSILKEDYDAKDKPELSIKRHRRALEKKYGFLPFIIKVMETEDHYLTKRFLKDKFANKYIHKYLQYDLNEKDIEVIKNEAFLEEYKGVCKKDHANYICRDCSHEITHKDSRDRYRYYCKKCKCHLCGPCQEEHEC